MNFVFKNGDMICIYDKKNSRVFSDFGWLWKSWRCYVCLGGR